MPVMDIAASVQSATSKMDDKPVGDLRGRVCSISRRIGLLPPNLQKNEQVSLKALRYNDDITILPADEGNPTLIMDVTQNEESIQDLLADPDCQKVKKDSTTATERKVLKAIRKLVTNDLIPINIAA